MDVIEPGMQVEPTAPSIRRTIPSRLVSGNAASVLATLAAAGPDRFDGAVVRELAPASIAALARAVPTVLADLAIDRVDAAGAAATDRPDLYPAPTLDDARDPRHGFSASVCEASLGRLGDAAALGAYWGGVVAALGRQGVAGARIAGLGVVPHGQLHPLVAALRQAAPDAILLLETNGLPWNEIATLTDETVDAVQCSLPWWNGRASWFEGELAALQPIGTVLAPFDQGPAGAAKHGIELAAARGIGFIAAATDAPAIEAAVRVAPLASQLTGLGVGRVLSAPGQTVLAALRTDVDPRFATEATLLLLNTDGTTAASFDPASVLPAVGGAFAPFAPIPVIGQPEPVHAKLVPGVPVSLPPGALLAFRATRAAGGTPLPLDSDSARRAGHWPRLALEDPSPAVDGGLFPVKRTAGEIVDVEIDVIGDGHDMLSAALQWQGPGDADWHECRMRLVANDRWTASFPLEVRGLHRYRVQAWRDAWATFRHELGAKHKAGVPIALELREGTELVRKAHARGHDALTPVLLALDGAAADTVRETLMSDETLRLMQAADNRPHGVHTAEMPVDAERTGAGFASWYEVFPRSMADDAARHGTFADVEKHLPRVKAMGFDVLYFPPIHPIGVTNRKGPNNTLTPEPHDVGSPYAVGTKDGGHDAIHPELGTLAEFLHLRKAAAAHGLELALDFAIQCSPDHPWLRDHKDWFEWRPDGSIRYAENPPKKYQDIVNVDFYADGSVPDLWMALANVVLFWCEQGIRLFRVDNPHTKPFPFWQWMIAEVRARYPDAVFLAEAFTRPKVMNRLGKVGFGQSYTYFTWRNSKAELTEYLTQLTEEAPKEFFRPHFFVNTPDINPFFLQNSDRPSFLIRAAAAATLSGLWGVYNGFELCEGARLAAGKEEYLDSEKFQIRHWDWTRPGNIVAEITRLNAIRNSSPALRSHRGVAFLSADNDAVLLFEKATPDRGDVLIVAISMDPHNRQTATIDLPLWKWGLPDQASLQIDDLVTDDSFVLHGRAHSLTLSPEQPYRIWRAAPAR